MKTEARKAKVAKCKAYIEFRGRQLCRMVCKRKCGHKGRHEADFLDGIEITPHGIWWDETDCGYLCDSDIPFGNPAYKAHTVFSGGGESYTYGEGVKDTKMYRRREGAVVEQLYESFCEEIGVRCPRRPRKLNKRPS